MVLEKIRDRMGGDMTKRKIKTWYYKVTGAIIDLHRWQFHRRYVKWDAADDSRRAVHV